MDAIDKALIKYLSENADCTATELSERVHLSVPAVNKRIARLKSGGVIQKVSIKVDEEKIGKPLMAYVLIVLGNQANQQKLLDYISEDPDITECHAISGEYDFILKIFARNIRDLESKLILLKGEKDVVKSNTLFSLMQFKSLSGPVPDDE